ncbi:MAG: class I SAM-dependent methyltransferase [Acidobacteria bacterium]|nr:class I SAM-dependent methyltransferase [Acidobacteriota bacterium]MBU4307243.1 class I SAM-dependent methyltransferase [Acidobacteriota bacterium]MBU4405035.1 class I SAM-dependent methyltransferase [Acidobacteriota bacterium]MCG2811479.1 class I SAM-dependent methyltransferase [Candidatus Aminicenantes bacterium]
MHPRIAIAKFLLKLGRFIQSSAVVVMRPNDLVEFSRRHYFKPANVQGWCDDQLVNSGFSTLEHSLLDKINVNKGRLLLLGLGGGREAIPLAKMGFEVTGVDFIPQMVEQAMANAKQNGVEISGVVQEISKLDLPENAFDIAWLSAAMYSCVPTRKRRGDMLKRIAKALRPGGYFVFGFFWNPKADVSSKSVFLKKMVAWLSLGNLQYEKGDMLRFNLEFIHAFTAIEELKMEIIKGGFELIDIQAIDGNEFAGAIARKPF